MSLILKFESSCCWIHRVFTTISNFTGNPVGAGLVKTSTWSLAAKQKGPTDLRSLATKMAGKARRRPPHTRCAVKWIV
ncbi:hypothetical protein GCK32_014875 [Trichostrongylus colubriformis]|uniref:Uncharacterized protein n=1 Tax=Trichostrongylus colubriformis TaxID=6319 RepID=A0AAN8G153_TRICO